MLTTDAHTQDLPDLAFCCEHYLLRVATQTDLWPEWIGAGSCEMAGRHSSRTNAPLDHSIPDWPVCLQKQTGWPLSFHLDFNFSLLEAAATAATGGVICLAHCPARLLSSILRWWSDDEKGELLLLLLLLLCQCSGSLRFKLDNQLMKIRERTQLCLRVPSVFLMTQSRCSYQNSYNTSQ